MSRHVVCHDYRGIPINNMGLEVVAKPCETQLIIAINDLVKSLDEGTQTDVIFLEFDMLNVLVAT